MKDSEPSWILTKLGGKTGMPIICSNHHPEYTAEQYDVKIGQACFEKNWRSGRIVEITNHLSLLGGQVFAFAEELNKQGIRL